MNIKQFKKFLEEKLLKTKIHTVYGDEFLTENFMMLRENKEFQLEIYPWQEITVKGNDKIGYQVLIVG